MGMKMEFCVISPCDIGKKDIEEILNLIIEGGEIQIDKGSLRKRIMRVQKLCLVKEEGQLIGLEGIKTPILQYRRKIMGKIIKFEGVEEMPDLEKVFFELGYLVIRKDFRGKKLSSQIRNYLLPSLQNSIFTLLKEENQKFLERGLIKQKFEKIGFFSSIYRDNIKIIFYLRDKINQLN